ncbi:hypothetical protein [uncultured Roseobacter sp.]|uniref:hypothetical protein n=1 Tax=uncultured Roseobacter sp. TaxID=114847 RepID=UPI00260CF1A2|nr:hypothetical protein [uncultured Roseobacter sp.]
MTDDTEISNTSLSMRARRALAKNDIYTVGELRLLLRECGSDYVRSRMLGIGAVTAEEIFHFLNQD